ncbi:MAG TPA: GNAT family N-acetyltransferase [Flavitalea sp.]|nr:GNAT family N-acetyltransferase [Flavitalea sp.]
MKSTFKYSLSDEEINELGEFYSSCEIVTIEQHPQWRLSIESHKNNCFFIGREEDRIVCSAVITETKKLGIKNASIDFGPLFKNPDMLIASIGQIYEYYKSNRFTSLTIQLALPTGSNSDYIEYKINKNLPVISLYDRNNWSSIVVDLSADEDQLLRNMSKGHRSDIKKVQKSSVTVTDDYTEDDFRSFIEVYIKMHRGRGLKEDDQGSSAYLNKIRSFFNLHGNGKFLFVKDASGTVLGGIVIIYQNKTVRYFKGAADPACRNIPVLHLAIWQAMCISKQNGFINFDLWGYNHFVNETDQVFFINRFKKGFGGDFTFYPKKMYFIFNPMQHKLYQIAQKLYHRSRKK